MIHAGIRIADRAAGPTLADAASKVDAAVNPTNAPHVRVKVMSAHQIEHGEQGHPDQIDHMPEGNAVDSGIRRGPPRQKGQDQHSGQHMGGVKSRAANQPDVIRTTVFTPAPTRRN